MAKGGKRPGAGRKSKAEELGLKHLLDKCFNDAARKKVIASLVKDASDPAFQIRDAARKLLLAYTFGQPAAKTEHSGNPDQPIEQRIVVEFI